LVQHASSNHAHRNRRACLRYSAPTCTVGPIASLRRIDHETGRPSLRLRAARNDRGVQYAALRRPRMVPNDSEGAEPLRLNREQMVRVNVGRAQPMSNDAVRLHALTAAGGARRATTHRRVGGLASKSHNAISTPLMCVRDRAAGPHEPETCDGAPSRSRVPVRARFAAIETARARRAPASTSASLVNTLPRPTSLRVSGTAMRCAAIFRRSSLLSRLRGWRRAGPGRSDFTDLHGVWWLMLERFRWKQPRLGSEGPFAYSGNMGAGSACGEAAAEFAARGNRGTPFTIRKQPVG